MGRFTTSRVIAFGALLVLLAAHPARAQQEAAWTWKDSQGKARTRADLDMILRAHRVWVESKTESGAQADLHGADLSGAILDSAEMTLANLAGADLKGAQLNRALLGGADLTGAELGGAKAFFADFRKAHLAGGHLSGVNLLGANLAEADLEKADLTGAYLGFTELTNANISEANLANAHMLFTKLSKASLGFANLAGADLRGAELEQTGVRYADFEHARFDVKSIPETEDMAQVRNLELLTYKENPDALTQLRRKFEEGGLRDQERKITYALKRREAELSWAGCTSRKVLENEVEKEHREKEKTPLGTRAMVWSSDSNLANCGSFALNRVLFDWTCQYGMSPGRPLSLGVLVWAFCSILYFVSIRASGEAGLYRVYAQSIHDDSSDRKRVEKISPPAITGTGRVRKLLQFFWREWKVMRASMFFSLMSAFNIGFRDINFGRWLRLLTRQEFDIKAVGWARVVAGWQSLISVYFIALWVLTYFGRPFG